jgi:cytochrome d ubiquinol oxidase subunit II
MDWLPIFFVGIMGFALLMYTVLDGYDLGIGMLLPFATEAEKDHMIATIGPFWDANETWIVLGVGVLLMAFPQAHGVVLTALYLPVAVMLIGLILRGAAFDFRVKAKTKYKRTWNRLFFIGSLMASMAQGWMLGRYVMGLSESTVSTVFAIAIACLLPVLYSMLGCGWLLVKTDGVLYRKAARWAKHFVLPLGVGLFIISIATPIASTSIAERWFALPQAIGLLPIPVASIMAYVVILWILSHEKLLNDDYGWVVFVALIVLCVMCAIGLAYSIYPDVIIDKMTIWEAAASRDALMFAFYGTIIAVPGIFLYTVFIYRVFAGKTTELSYESPGLE